MAEALLLKPDRKFVEEVIAAGGGDLKKCYQCATCSVVCGLSNGPSPFPRKEMIWAQWGLKDRLVSDPDIWLCHQCNDCSLRCPRGARPGDVLAAVRQKAIEHYAFPSAMGRLVNSVRAIPIMLLLIPALLIAGALLVRGPIEAAFPVLVGEHAHEFYGYFFPHWLLIAFYTSLTLLTFGGLIVALFSFWDGMKATDAALGRGAPQVGVIPSVIKAVTTVLTHDRFGTCTDQASRKPAHLMAFYGFLALFIVTSWAVLDLYLMPFFGIDSRYPFDLLHPMKILANVGGILLIIGSGKAILTRKNAPKDGYHQSTTFDWIFVWLLLLVGISGFIVETLRFVAEGSAGAEAYAGAFALPAYSIYFVHLVFVFGLLVYLPYSKFAHMWYRLVAMVYGEYSGRTGPGSKLVKVSGMEG
ncbi:MAG: quinone-interacting membrane-bound oxidoreductase complex subunit QmoC [Longimicrobiales bacterium]|nr:quinone-interacting membrane-bound oxidoreductase complex subunit QmoC [Longimicrobiales bacterium]